MIILRKPEPKILVPVPDAQWREPSAAQPRDQMGNPTVCTRFRIDALAHDGGVMWRGWFESRYDFDAFLWAIAIGSLRHEPALWRLPMPHWQPYLDEAPRLAVSTVTFLTSTSASTYNVPGDWNSAINKIEGIGGGGNGAVAGTVNGGGGGGGGAYADGVNIVLTPGGTAAYRCGASGGTTGSGTTPTGNTYFKDASTIVAAGGASGSGTAAGAGGTVANSVYLGGSAFAGGSGGAGGPAASGGSGGGAGGPNAAGGNGVPSPVTAGGAGGNGNGGLTGGGAGGAAVGSGAQGNPGQAGTYWSSAPAYGPGGGGGAGSANAGTCPGQPGGNYGAAASGNYNGGAGAAGTQGLIVLTYTPLSVTALSWNMPMIGM